MSDSLAPFVEGMIIGSEGGGQVSFQWNPKSINVHKKSKWNHLHAAGREQPILQYGCGDPVEYSFDIDLSRSNRGDDWVKSQAEKLFAFTQTTSKGAGVDSPPQVQLILGSLISVTCILEEITSIYGPLFNPQSLLAYQGKCTLHLTEVKS